LRLGIPCGTPSNLLFFTEARVAVLVLAWERFPPLLYPQAASLGAMNRFLTGPEDSSP